MPGLCDPMLPLHARLRDERARAPEPIEYDGRLHDIMGVSPEGELMLRDQRAIHQDLRIERLAGCVAVLDGAHWRVASLEATGPINTALELRLEGMCQPYRTVTLTSGDGALRRVRFTGMRGEHTLGPVKHGIVRMAPIAPRDMVRMPLRAGQRFEARLRGRELDGPYAIDVTSGGRLKATVRGRGGRPRRGSIEPAQVAPRYEVVTSLDFGSSFDVDAFLFHEDQLRGRAAGVGADPARGPVQDPLLGRLPGDAAPRLTSGAQHLSVMAHFIRSQAQRPEDSDVSVRRRLTVLNLSMSNQGDARGVLDALVEFRRVNPDADMAIVVSKLGPSEFQNSPEFHRYVALLAANRIHVDAFTRGDGSTRRVMHAKGIIIDNRVLFTTGAVMDTRPINKADFSIELPAEAAAIFGCYTCEAVHGDATDERRAELAAKLARRGVIINDPVAGLPYISRAQDALIRGASRQLLVSLSEILDPAMTRTLIDRAASGVAVVIQVRELDRASARALMVAMPQCKNLCVEDSSWWEPRPHFNAIVADGIAAYVGTSYLWPTQRNMVHQGRSFENGVLLAGDAAAVVRLQIHKLRARAYHLGPLGPPSRALGYRPPNPGRSLSAPSIMAGGLSHQAGPSLRFNHSWIYVWVTNLPLTESSRLAQSEIALASTKEKIGAVDSICWLPRTKVTPGVLWENRHHGQLDCEIPSDATREAVAADYLDFFLPLGTSASMQQWPAVKIRLQRGGYRDEFPFVKNYSYRRFDHNISCLKYNGEIERLWPHPRNCHSVPSDYLTRGDSPLNRPLEVWNQKTKACLYCSWMRKEFALLVDFILALWLNPGCHHVLPRATGSAEIPTGITPMSRMPSAEISRESQLD